MRRRWKAWRAASHRTRLLVVEAAVCLACARVMVAFFLRWTVPWVVRHRTENGGAPPLPLERDVRHAVRVAAAAVPWKSVCLPNAIAAKMMLARRGYAATIHLGVGYGAGGLHAHAWLEAGGMVITGQKGIGSVVPFGAHHSQ